MRLLTGLLSMLFGLNQPYGDARKIPCDVVLELLESKLDEGFSYLDGDGPRLARKELEAIRAFGSVAAMVQAAREEARDAPTA